MPRTVRATWAPVERFRKVAGRVQLRYGDLAFLSEATGRSTGHLSRVITGDRESRELADEIERLVGVPVSRIDLPRARATA